MNIVMSSQHEFKMLAQRAQDLEYSVEVSTLAGGDPFIGVPVPPLPGVDGGDVLYLVDEDDPDLIAAIAWSGIVAMRYSKGPEKRFPSKSYGVVLDEKMIIDRNNVMVTGGKIEGGATTITPVPHFMDALREAAGLPPVNSD